MPAPRVHLAPEATPPDSGRLAFFRKILFRWGRANFAPFPWRFTTNRFHGLIAEVMLQRTRADQVVPVYQEFIKRYPAPNVAASEDAGVVERVLQPLGLEWRARIIRRLVNTLSESSGHIPTTIGRLQALPGVGDYAASAFRTLHLGKPTRMIDANIVRLYGRYFGHVTGPETRRARWFISLAEQVQPSRNARAFGYALLDFTRSICTPVPRCDICPLREKCLYATRKSV
jgi:A/G-specific adenine glycosylase